MLTLVANSRRRPIVRNLGKKGPTGDGKPRFQEPQTNSPPVGGHSSEREKSYAKGQQGGWQKPCRRDPVETRRFQAVSPCLKAWRETLVSRHACSPGEDAKPFFNASSVPATRLSVQFRPFRGVT